MSWLTNIINKNGANPEGEKQSEINAFISLEYHVVRFLFVEEKDNIKKILSWNEIFTGPFEDLEEGKPVKDLGKTLEKILTQNISLFKEVTHVSVSLPSEGVFFKTIEVPSLDEKEITKLILAEFKTTLPVDFSQILFAQNDIGSKHEGQKSFFCVSVQKNFFEEMKQIFNKFSFDPYFEIESFSLARIPVRDDKYKILVFVSKRNSYIILLQGQIIQEVLALDFGDDEITQSIVKVTGLSFADVTTLRSGHEILKNEGRYGANILDQYVKDFNQKLSKTISLNILNFEKKYNTEIKELTILGADASTKLQKNINEEFDAELTVDILSDKHFDQFEAENFKQEDVKRFAQCFGLAKRAN